MRKRAVFFSSCACACVLEHCYHTHTLISPVCLDVQPLGPPYYLSIKPLIFFHYRPWLCYSPFPSLPCPSLSTFSYLPRLLTLSTFISLVVSYIPLSSSPLVLPHFEALSLLPTSPSVPICGPRQSCLAQTGTKGKETSSGDALLSHALIWQH